MAETLDLVAVNEILVKFRLPKWQPFMEGIPERERASDSKMDVKHQLDAIKAGRNDLVEVGRVREGRVDTGEQVINEKNVSVDSLRRELAAEGYFLSDLHLYRRSNDRNPQPAFFIVAHLSRDPKTDGVQLTSAQKDAFERMGGTVWGFANVWKNPNGVATINLSGRQEGARPQKTLTVRDGAVAAV